MSRVVQATGWGDLAAAALQPGWTATIEPAGASSLLLRGDDEALVRIVPAHFERDPFHLHLPLPGSVLPPGAPAQRARVVEERLFLGDRVLRLPVTAPWISRLHWGIEHHLLGAEPLARGLALLGDWLLARGPDSALTGRLPELLERPARAGGVVADFVPALFRGDLARAERAIPALVAAGEGRPTEGEWFVVGLIAGIQLWPIFSHGGSGLLAPSLLDRMARSAMERSSPLGAGWMAAALESHYGEQWHLIHRALTRRGSSADRRRDALRAAAADWLARDRRGGAAALAGLLLPFLWFQRHAE